MRRDFRIIARFLADKPSDSDGKAPELKPKAKEPQKAADSSTEKIQELLKLMMAEPKIKESEYKEKFVTAPQIDRKRRTEKVEVTTEKIGLVLCYLID